MKLAVMQPCYLPWQGYFALMRHADVFLYLDDVPLPQGRSLQTRVAIRTTQGRQWLTVPIHHQSDQLIREVQIVEGSWRQKHLRSLRQHLPRSTDVVADLYDRPWTHLAAFNIALTNRMADSLGLSQGRPFERTGEYHVSGHGWRKILNLCQTLGADTYITAHGARHYFDHDAFARAGVDVFYLDYNLEPYSQPHGEFDPYLTALDVLEFVADPNSYIHATLVPWWDFLTRHQTPTNATPASHLRSQSQ